MSSTARRGAHVRGGGVQGSVPGQSSPAHGRADVRGRFRGRLSVLLAPEVAASSRRVWVTFSESLSRGTTTFPQAHQCRTRFGWVSTGSWKPATSSSDGVG